MPLTAIPPRSSSAFPRHPPPAPPPHPFSDTPPLDPLSDNGEDPESDAYEPSSSVPSSTTGDGAKSEDHAAYAYHSLEEWAAHRVRARLPARCSRRLVWRFSRSVLLSFSVGPLAAVIMATAPVLWSILTAVAVSFSVNPDEDSQPEPESSQTHPRRPKCSRGKGKTLRDLWLVRLACLSINPDRLD